MSRELQLKFKPARSYARPLLAFILIIGCVSFSIIWVEGSIFKRALVTAAVCLTLWLTEVVPPHVPTFVLWALTSLLLHGFGDQFQLSRALGWSANPVLALFLGGFALSVAASRFGTGNSVRYQHAAECYGLWRRRNHIFGPGYSGINPDDSRLRGRKPHRTSVLNLVGKP
jgi:hypothetical protein